MKKTLKFLLSLTAFSMVVGTGVALANGLESNQIAQQADAADKGKVYYLKFEEGFWDADARNFAVISNGNWYELDKSKSITPIGTTDTLYPFELPASSTTLRVQRRNPGHTEDWGTSGTVNLSGTGDVFKVYYNGGFIDGSDYNVYKYSVTCGTGGSYAKIGNSSGDVGTTSGYMYKHMTNYMNASPASGYQFKDWTISGGTVTSESGTTSSKNYGFSKPTGDLSVTANFELIPAATYTVAFNCGTGSGTMESRSVEVGQTITAPTPTFTAPAHQKFKHWSGSNGNTYAVGATIPSQTKNTTITLTAIWEDFSPSDGYWIEFFNSGRNPQRVKLTHNGKSDSTSEWTATGVALTTADEFKIVRYESESIPLGEYWGTKYAESKEGAAIHDGQFVSKDSSDDPNFKVAIAGSYNFYFKDMYNLDKLWVPSITYEVQYHANEGTGSDYVIHPKLMSSDQHFYAATFETAEFTAPTGKIFKEWNTQADGQGTPYAPNAKVTNSKTQNQIFDLYAIYKDSVADGVYLRGVGGKWDEKDQLEMIDNPSTSGEKMIQHVGLAANSEVRPIKYVSNKDAWIDINSVTTDDSTYTASKSGDNAKINKPGVFNIYTNPSTGTLHFQPLKVTYNGNGSTSGSVNNNYPAETGGVTISPNGYNKTGYSFIEWNTQADGKGTSYAPNDTYNFITAEATGNLNLYAIWEQSGYTVTLKAGSNFKSAEDIPIPVSQGDYYLPECPGEFEPNKGYYFFGWKYNSQTLPAGTKIQISGNVTLTSVAQVIYSGELHVKASEGQPEPDPTQQWLFYEKTENNVEYYYHNTSTVSFGEGDYIIPYYFPNYSHFEATLDEHSEGRWVLETNTTGGYTTLTALEAGTFQVRLLKEEIKEGEFSYRWLMNYTDPKPTELLYISVDGGTSQAMTLNQTPASGIAREYYITDVSCNVGSILSFTTNMSQNPVEYSADAHSNLYQDGDELEVRLNGSWDIYMKQYSGSTTWYCYVEGFDPKDPSTGEYIQYKYGFIIDTKDVSGNTTAARLVTLQEDPNKSPEGYTQYIPSEQLSVGLNEEISVYNHDKTVTTENYESFNLVQCVGFDQGVVPFEKVAGDGQTAAKCKIAGLYKTYFIPESSGYNRLYVASEEGLAKQFALNFLGRVRDVCDWDGKTGQTELETVWADLAGHLKEGETAPCWLDITVDARGFFRLNATVTNKDILDCLELYDYIYRKYGAIYDLDDYMGRFPDGAPQSTLSFDGIFTDFTDGSSSNPTLIIVISSVITGLALGGYFLLRRRKED